MHGPELWFGFIFFSQFTSIFPFYSYNFCTFTFSNFLCEYRLQFCQSITIKKKHFHFDFITICPKLYEFFLSLSTSMYVIILFVWLCLIICDRSGYMQFEIRNSFYIFFYMSHWASRRAFPYFVSFYSECVCFGRLHFSMCVLFCVRSL